MLVSHAVSEGQSQGLSPDSQVAESLLPSSAPQLPRPQALQHHRGQGAGGEQSRSRGQRWSPQCGGLQRAGVC